MGGSDSQPAPRRFRPLLASGLSLALAIAPAASASAVGPAISGVTAMRAAAAAADQTAWRKVWSDTFAGLAGSGINSRRWQYDTGAGVFGTGEVETMTNSHANVALDGLGNLDITALEQNGSWTSGRVQTLDTFAAPAGGEMLVTAEIRQPSPAGGLGYWAAFWMLGAGGWPQNGEIDIMEDVNAGSELSATAHCGHL